MDEKYNQPRLALNRIYTRTGDRGETSLAGGQRVPKYDPRIECYGTIDELNSFLGMACCSATEVSAREPRIGALARILERIQHELFNLGSIIATLPHDVHPRQPRVTEADVKQLESEIDSANAELAPLRSFVLPGGSRLNTELHACRTVCRRAERLLVKLAEQDQAPPEAIQYLNRLSDALFVWSRWVNHVLGAPETLWSPNEAASAKSSQESWEAGGAGVHNQSQRSG
jgi:cob(I)alamin adenosyltransferase